jgi:hypothetical protein
LFGSTSLHQLQFSFANHLSNTVNFTSFPKKFEVGSNFNIFMKQQNRCYMNRYFKLPCEVESKLPAIATGYIENGSFYLFSHLAAPLETRGKKCSLEPSQPESAMISSSHRRSHASSSAATHPVPRPPMRTTSPSTRTTSPTACRLSFLLCHRCSGHRAHDPTAARAHLRRRLPPLPPW